MLGQAEVQRVAFVVHVLHLCVKTVKQILRCLAAAGSIVCAALRHRVVEVAGASWRGLSHRVDQTSAAVLNVVLDETIHPVPLPEQLYLLPARCREYLARKRSILRVRNILNLGWKADTHDATASGLHRSGELAELT